MEALHPKAQRILFFLEKANLSPPSRIPIWTTPLASDLDAPSPTSVERARLLLTQQSDCKAPKKHFRHKLMPQSRQDKLNHDAKQPKIHEVALAFNKLLLETPVGASDTAQAILSSTPGTSLYELWRHFHDAKLEDRMASRLKRMKSRLGRSQTPVILDAPWIWLNRMIEPEDLAYVRLMCQSGLEQETLNKILSVAMLKLSLDVIEILLKYGAVASSHKEAVRQRLKQDGIALAGLLLSAPGAMDIEAWRYSIEPYTDSPPDVLLLCLAHRQEIVCGTLLLKALESENFPATATILAYADLNEDFRDVRQNVCELTTRIEHPKKRHEFFRILVDFGCVQDNHVLREELMKDVKLRLLPLIKILTGVGVCMDIEPNNVISWAILQMDFEVLELIRTGNFSSPISPLLGLVPLSTSEHDRLYLFDLLSPLGLTGEPLHLCLIHAVEQHHVRLAEKLIQIGASIEFRQASAIRMAISTVDLDLLDILLQAKISKETLSSTIDTAMTLYSKHSRFQVMEVLLKKGVTARALDIPLQIAVIQEGDIDFELVKLLLRQEASVDSIPTYPESVVSIAARRGNVLLLRLLCDAKPRVETLARAVPVAFEAMNSHGYNIAQSMIKMLLSKGACGTPVHETLISAAATDHAFDIVRLLIKNGATANYKSGACYAIAIKVKASGLLRMLCRDCPPSHECLAAILLTATSPAYFDLPNLELLLSSTPSVGDVLNLAVNPDLLKNNPKITTIIPCLLRHGLDVDVQDGFLCMLAIEGKNDSLLREILHANPRIDSLKSAFSFAIRGEVKAIDLRILELLLDKAESAEIGQSAALTKYTRHALSGDSQGLELLIRHGAKVNHTDVEALLVAAKAGAFDTIKLLLASRPKFSALKRVCLAVDGSNLNTTQKSSIILLLLDANGGFSVDDMSKLLNDCVIHSQESIQLANLLLKRGAETSFRILKMAMARPSPELVVAMINSLDDPQILIRSFQEAQIYLSRPDKAVSIYRCLLNKDVLLGNHLPEILSQALVESLNTAHPVNVPLMELFLQRGAMIGYRNGEAFRRALGANAVDAVMILSQYISDDSVAHDAFAHALKAPLKDQNVRLQVYRCLLRHNIGGSFLHEALVKAINESTSSLPILKLLLETGANPNSANAVCFVWAAQAWKEAEFRLLCKYAKLEVVLPRLLSEIQEEREVAKWFRICLGRFSRTSIAGQDELLRQCLGKFPLGTRLLTLLLDNGISTSALFSCQIRRDLEFEKLTVLIWALMREPRIATDTILTLIAKGGRKGLSLLGMKMSRNNFLTR